MKKSPIFCRALRITASAVLLAISFSTVPARRSEARTADELALMLGVSRDGVRRRRSAEKWVDETWLLTYELSKGSAELIQSDIRVNMHDIIKIGTPAYDRIIKAAQYCESFNISPELIASELSKVVEYGGAELFIDGESDPRAKRTLKKASSWLPARIVRSINSRMKAIKAFYVIGRGRISGNTIRTNGLRTSLHELGHAWEYSDRRLLGNLKTEFYEHRTRNKKIRNLNNLGNTILHFPFGYRAGEKYKAGFVDQYMGKADGVELYSCGIEYVFFNANDIWHRDPETTRFILGSLIFYGSLRRGVEGRR
ncbi:MAG: hypothetical protein LBT23_01155 [Synergistaceae bacterium]|nr:hypothetical protein [Synergistaceae bacterium]